MEQKPAERCDFLQLFNLSVQRYAENPAIITKDGRTISYAQLAEHVETVSRTMHLRGIRRGSGVLLNALPPETVIISFLAVTGLGATCIVRSNVTQQELRTMAIALIVTKDGSQEFGIPTLWFPGDFERREAPAYNLERNGLRNGDDLACVIQSSGTTGKPKSYSLTIDQLSQSIMDQASFLPRPLKRTSLTVPPTALFGLEMAFVVLASGGCMDWESAYSVDPLMSSRIDHIISSPLWLLNTTDYVRAQGASNLALDYCIVAGSKISPEFVQRIRTTLNCELYTNYGSTEVGPVSFGSTDYILQNPVYAGNIAPWVTVSVLSEDGMILETGKTGRLGFSLSGGRYIARATELDQTAKTTQFISGDFGHVDTENRLFVEGRDVDLINVGGQKVSLQAIKRTIQKETGITGPLEVISAVSVSGWDRLIIVIAADPQGIAQCKARIRRMSRRGFDGAEIQMMFVRRMPTNAFGKVDFTKLRERAQSVYLGRKALKQT